MKKGQDHLDDFIKEELGRRQFHPSEEAWGKLENMLDASREDSKRLPWRNLAAAVLALLVAAGLFISYQLKETPSKTIADQPVNASPAVDKEVQEAVLPDEEVVVSVKKDAPEMGVPKHSGLAIPGDKSERSEKSILPEKEVPEKILLADTKKEQLLTRDDEKAAEVAATIVALQEQGEVSDEEIEALLLQAQKELHSEKIFKGTTVDAMALLQDVEEELDHTFKDRVFEMIKTGFRKVKTAVVERNQ